MSDHIRSLDILSEWMFEQRLDLALPDGVLNPAESAGFIRYLIEENDRLQKSLDYSRREHDAPREYGAPKPKSYDDNYHDDHYDEFPSFRAMSK